MGRWQTVNWIPSMLYTFSGRAVVVTSAEVQPRNHSLAIKEKSILISENI